MKKIILVFCLLLLCSCTKTSVETCPPVDDNEFTVHFHTDGGSVIEDIKVNTGSNDKIKLETPTKEGYYFEAWYYDESHLMRVNGEYTTDLEYVFTRDNEGCENGYRDLDLYALWLKNPS